MFNINVNNRFSSHQEGKRCEFPSSPLPREIIYQIFSEIKDPYSLARCGKVNTEWNAVSNDNGLWKKFDFKWDSTEKKQIKKISKELDQQSIQLEKKKKPLLTYIQQHLLPKITLKDLKANKIEWLKVATIPVFLPLLGLYYCIFGPTLIAKFVKLQLINKNLEVSKVKRKNVADPRLAFGTMWKLMQDPELLKRTYEQNLIPREFVEFVSSHVNEYKKSEASLFECEYDYFLQYSMCAADIAYREKLGLMTTKFNILQGKFYHAFVLQKIQNLMEIILKAEPGKDEIEARTEAIRNLKEKYGPRTFDNNTDFFRYNRFEDIYNTYSNYKAQMMMDVLSEMH